MSDAAPGRIADEATLNLTWEMEYAAFGGLKRELLAMLRDHFLALDEVGDPEVRVRSKRTMVDIMAFAGRCIDEGGAGIMNRDWSVIDIEPNFGTFQGQAS